MYNGRVGFASLVSKEHSAHVYEHIYTDLCNKNVSQEPLIA